MSNAKFGTKEVMDVVLYDMETGRLSSLTA